VLGAEVESERENSKLPPVFPQVDERMVEWHCIIGCNEGTL